METAFPRVNAKAEHSTEDQKDTSGAGWLAPQPVAVQVLQRTQHL